MIWFSPRMGHMSHTAAFLHSPLPCANFTPDQKMNSSINSLRISWACQARCPCFCSYAGPRIVASSRDLDGWRRATLEGRTSLSCWADGAQHKAESRKPASSDFDPRETRFLHACRLVDQTALPGTSGAFHIEDEQASPRFEHASNFRESCPLEVIGQVVHHKRTQYHTEALIGKRELLDHPDLEIYRQATTSRFVTGLRDHLR